MEYRETVPQEELVGEARAVLLGRSVRVPSPYGAVLGTVIAVSVLGKVYIALGGQAEPLSMGVVQALQELRVVPGEHGLP